MRNHLKLTLSLFLSALVLSHSYSFSQKKSGIDLTGYQDFKWGASFNSVRSLLNSSGIKIKSSKQNEITVDAKIELDGFPPSIDMEKTFVFIDRKLSRVVVRHTNSDFPYRMSKLYSKLLPQLVSKYGKCAEDTTMEGDPATIRGTLWHFRSGDIMLQYLELPEDSDLKALEYIMIIYCKKESAETIEKRQKERTDKQL